MCKICTGISVVAHNALDFFPEPDCVSDLTIDHYWTITVSVVSGCCCMAVVAALHLACDNLRAVVLHVHGFYRDQSRILWESFSNVD